MFTQLFDDTYDEGFLEIWSEPITDTINIAGLVSKGLNVWFPGKEPSDEMIIGLTRLVMEREEHLSLRYGDDSDDSDESDDGWPNDGGTDPIFPLDEQQLNALRTAWESDTEPSPFD